MLTVSREVIEQPHERNLWGRACTVEPRFVEEALGNGDRLLIITPTNTRPNYYVIRVDSGWQLDSDGDGETVLEHMDEIQEAITGEYGEEEDGEDAEREGWPVLSASSGCTWGELSIEEYGRMVAQEAEGVGV